MTILLCFNSSAFRIKENNFSDPAENNKTPKPISFKIKIFIAHGIIYSNKLNSVTVTFVFTVTSNITNNNHM